MRSKLAVLFGVTCLCAVLSAAPAFAAFPGRNGEIAFAMTRNGNADVYTVNPDGSGLTQLTTTPEDEIAPAWSVDGKHIVFGRGFEVWRMDADGSNEMYLNVAEYPPYPSWSPYGTQIAHAGITIGPSNATCCHTRITNQEYDGYDLWPAWSPDGTKIAFARYRDNDYDIYLVRPDGTGLVNLTSSSAESAQMSDWSPNGQRIVWGSEWFGGVHIMNADGTGDSVVPGTERDRDPAFSPDGSRIVASTFIPQPVGDTQLVTYAPDGSGRVLIPGTQGGGLPGLGPDWQSVGGLPPGGHPRPRAATPLEVSLVPAYGGCVSPSHRHGPPLAYPSCSPPRGSDGVVLGTPDANGKAAKGAGLVRYGAINGDHTTAADEADVRIVVELSDVYDRSTLTDYRGELVLGTDLRITDKLNDTVSDGRTGGTVEDTTLSTPVPCAGTSDQTRGGRCALITTVEAVIPGAIPEGKRSVWELGQVHLDDLGADNDADTVDDNAPFMVQGVFVP
jgi:TolB protein